MDIAKSDKRGMASEFRCDNCGPTMGKSCTLVCGRCCSVNYCCLECQKKDWKQKHHLECEKLVLSKATASIKESYDQELEKAKRESCSRETKASELIEAQIREEEHL